MVVRKRILARWVPWLFGLGLLAAVVMFATHARKWLSLSSCSTPGLRGWSSPSCSRWNLVAETRIDNESFAVRTSRSRSDPIGLALAKLFIDQAIRALA